MGIDARTMLLLVLGIAVIAAGFLASEWWAVRARALLFWSAGFAAIAIGCAISPLRSSVSIFVGIWVANGLLVVAHLLFLDGAADFQNRRVSPFWWTSLISWAALLSLPASVDTATAFGMANAGLVTMLSLRTAFLLLGKSADALARRLGAAFLAHGVFYAVKTGLVLVPGAVVDILTYKGLLIQVSLLWGVLIEVVLCLLMVVAARRRREEQVAALAEQDPLTGALNRRGFQSRAVKHLRRPRVGRHGGALLLLDVDHFKTVNDACGHAVGDKLLIVLTDVLTAAMPPGALIGRLGGDEFTILMPDLEELTLALLPRAIETEFALASARLRELPVIPTVSIGAALFGGETADLWTLMENADVALYEAKRRGRNQLCIHQCTAPVPSTATDEGRVTAPRPRDRQAAGAPLKRMDQLGSAPGNDKAVA